MRKPRATTDFPDCPICGKRFTRTLSQRKRGRIYCSWDCYLVDRAKKGEESRIRKAETPCGNDSCNRLGIVARGLCNACYQQWNIKFGKSSEWLEKKCPTCHETFPTHLDRKFCSLDCYVNSSVFHDARAAYSKKMAEARIKGECLNCGKEMSMTKSEGQGYMSGDKHRKAKRFCTRSCWREWLSERFDRAVAHQTGLQLPCSYDEFLAQEELPCLVEDCNWVGHGLSMHCNMEHGINADELKALAGFNRKTGVISQTLRIALEARENVGVGILDEVRSNPASEGTKWSVRPEGREHHKKAHLTKE